MRPVTSQTAFLTTTGRGRPLGYGSERLRVGEGCGEGVNYCIDRPVGRDVPVRLDESLVDVAWQQLDEAAVHLTTSALGFTNSERSVEIVRLGAFRPLAIAGSWSNVAILAGWDPARPLVGAVVGPDSLTPLPMPPESLMELDADVLLRTRSRLAASA